MEIVVHTAHSYVAPQSILLTPSCAKIYVFAWLSRVSSFPTGLWACSLFSFSPVLQTISIVTFLKQKSVHQVNPLLNILQRFRYPYTINSDLSGGLLTKEFRLQVEEEGIDKG